MDKFELKFELSVNDKLAPDEIILLAAYRQLTRREREMLRGYACYLADRQEPILWPEVTQ